MRPKIERFVAESECPSKLCSAPSRKFTSTGTSVLDKTYDANMAKTTASAMGVKRYFAGPVRKTTETKTMQIVRVDTSVGVAISEAPISTASLSDCEPMWR